MERKNIYIVILTITTIIAACFALYFAINPMVTRTETKEENDLVTGDNVTTSNVSDVKDNTLSNIVNPNITVEEKSIRPEINTDKCLNAQEGHLYSAFRSYSDDSLGITCTIKKDNKVEVSFSNWDTLTSNYGVKKTSNLNDGGYYTYVVVDNFSGKKVVDIYLKGMGQGIGQEVIYFLMEDGTVQYMPIRKAMQNSDFRSYGNIEGLSNIVEIVDGSSNIVNGPGYLTPFAITKDGSCYELYPLVDKLLY